MSLSAPPGLSERIVAACDVTPRELAWLWLFRLALGKLALLDGDPGLGKSLVALDLCARLSTGRPWPDGSPGPGPAPALFLSGEDASDDVTLPRLRALGADLGRVFVIDQTDRPGGPLLFPEHVAYLEEVVARTGARLVVIDPITAFLDRTVVLSNDQSVRRGLRPLQELAHKYRCVTLFLRHLNKDLGMHALYRGLGAIGLAGLCRTVWVAAPDPDDPGRCVLAQAKTNVAAPQPSLAYSVPREKGVPPLVTWHGEVPWTAAQLLARAPAAPRQRELERAREFLGAFLKAGPRPAADGWAAAAELGLTRRTLRRAKKDLGVRQRRVATDTGRPWYWLLPGQQPPSAPGPAELEPWLGPLRARYEGAKEQPHGESLPETGRHD